MASYNVLKNRLMSLLKKFKLDEFDTLFNKGITFISVKDINQCIHEFKLPQTCASVADTFIYLYEKKQPSVEELESTLYQILACDLALHSCRKTKWAAVAMERDVKELPNTLEDLNADIQKAYEAAEQDLTVNAYSIYQNKVVWTVLVPKVKLKKGGLSRARAPLFFAYKPSLDLPHFLFSPPKLDKNLHLQIYVDCLGYDGYSLIDYEGSDALGMFNCIDKGSQAVTEPLPIYLPAVPGGEIMVREKDGIIDFSHSEDRKAYAQQIFTSKSHQYFKAVCDGTLVDCGSNLSGDGAREEIEFLSSIEFATSGNTSVEEMFKHLVSIGAVTMPIPEYMLNISNTPSNTITFQGRTVLSDELVPKYTYDLCNQPPKNFLS